MKWNLLPPSEKAVELAAAYDLDPLSASILLQRGLDAERFLKLEHYQPTPPSDVPDLDAAAQILLRERTAKILIWADFDVDGQTAAALLYEALSKQGASVRAEIATFHAIDLPHFDAVVAEFKPQVVILCDFGNVPASLLERDFETIIVDHHSSAMGLNPQRLPASHPLKHMPSVGVAFLLMQRFYAHLKKAAQLISLYDLLALGILADNVPPLRDTRYWLLQGLNALKTTRRPGLLSLFEKAEIETLWLTADDVRFQVIPRLSVFGRLDEAGKAFKLLTTRNNGEALMLATEADALNQKRRMMSRQVLEAVRAQLQNDPSLLEDYSAIVVANAHWEGGVISSVASQIAAEYQRPAVLLTLQGEIARGSARAEGGYSVLAALEATQDLLTRFGGHEQAAGLALPEESVLMFRRRFSNAITEQTVEQPVLTISAELPLEKTTLTLARDIEKLAPFGNGHPNPIFTTSVRFLSAAKIGEQHRRWRVRDSQDTEHHLFRWNSVHLLEPAPSAVDIAYEMAPVYRDGAWSVQLTVIDWRPTYATSESVAVKPDVLDYRQDLQLATLQEAETNLVIWAEGFSQRETPGVTRSEIEPAEALLIYTAPPAPQVLEKILEKAAPRRIYIHAAMPLFDTAPALVQAIAGLLQSRIGQRVQIRELAERTAHMPATIHLALDCLTADLEWHSGASFTVRSVASGKISAALNRAVQEAAAYRRYFQRAHVEDLIE